MKVCERTLPAPHLVRYILGSVRVSRELVVHEIFYLFVGERRGGLSFGAPKARRSHASLWQMRVSFLADSKMLVSVGFCHPAGLVSSSVTPLQKKGLGQKSIERLLPFPEKRWRRTV